jgi:hypothetical protein
MTFKMKKASCILQLAFLVMQRLSKPLTVIFYLLVFIGLTSEIGKRTTDSIYGMIAIGSFQHKILSLKHLHV